MVGGDERRGRRSLRVKKERVDKRRGRRGGGGGESSSREGKKKKMCLSIREIVSIFWLATLRLSILPP